MLPAYLQALTNLTSDSTADVYAGDINCRSNLDGSVEGLYVYVIEADAEPSTFARIANVFNIASRPPDRVILEVNKGTTTMNLMIELSATWAVAQLILRKLTQLTDMIHVLLRPVVDGQSEVD